MRRIAWILSLSVMICIGVLLGRSTSAWAVADSAEASGPRFDVAVFVDSRTDVCYSSGYFEAINRLTRLMETEINKNEIHGRSIKLHIYDGKRDIKTAAKQIREALGKKQLLAMIGLSSSTRAEKILAEVGEDIRKSEVPFISHISVSNMFKSYPTVFSTRPTQEVERAPIMARFMRANNIESVAFLGRKNAPYIEAVRSGLKDNLDEKTTVVMEKMLTLHGKVRGGHLDIDELNAAVAELKILKPAMLVLAVGSRLSSSVLQRLVDEKVTPQIFLVGSVSRLSKKFQMTYPNAIYETSWGNVPEVVSDRAVNVLRGKAVENWLFAGKKIAAAKGWAAGGKCHKEPRPEPELLSADNLRAIQRGAQFADMVKLVATSAAKARKSSDIKPYHSAILNDLRKTYISGRGAFKGTFENWSFYSDSRARARTPFVVILPQKLGRRQLAPKQFIRVRDHKAKIEKDGNQASKYKNMETIYVDVDLIRVYGVDNNEKSFFADFYLAMRKSEDLGIEDIAFTNAFLDPRMIGLGKSNGRQIIIEHLNADDGDDAYPREMKMYKISGRFRFNPDFSSYPFDTQILDRPAAQEGK